MKYLDTRETKGMHPYLQIPSSLLLYKLIEAHEKHSYLDRNATWTNL
jgi:hypothetical protein